MKYLDLSGQIERVRSEFKDRVEAILDHGQFINGPEVTQCEADLATFAGTQECVVASSGTTALMMALLAAEIGPGDRILVPGFSFFATAEAVMLLGATPVPIDIDPETYNLDTTVLSGLDPRDFKAVIPVSLFGQPADLDEIMRWAAQGETLVIEDGAQSFGAHLSGRTSASVAHMSVASFFPAKPLGAFGDAGAVLTSDPQLAGKLRAVRDHGQTSRYHHVHLGLNGRLDSIQCAALVCQIPLYREMIAQRQKAAELYLSGLQDSPGLQGGSLGLPSVRSDRDSVWAQFTIRTASRDQFIDHLKSKNVPCSVHYPVGMHQQPIFSKFYPEAVSLPEVERAAREVVSLPLYPGIPEADQERVIEVVNAFGDSARSRNISL